MILSSPWRCLACGDEAVLVGASLDPERPMGRCLGLHRRGALVPLTRDLAELDRALRSSTANRARVRHAGHLAGKGKLHPLSCQYCRALVERRAAGHA